MRVQRARIGEIVGDEAAPLLTADELALPVAKTRGGGVVHWVPCEESKSPFVPPMTECHSVELRPDDVVVDVGAYCGTYALWAAERARAVVAYEPTPSTFAILRANAGGVTNVRLVWGAVTGDDTPTVALNISRGIGVTNSITTKRGAARTVKVPAVTYAKAVAGATVVKIDVEGAEYAYPLVQPGIRALIVDFHPRPDLDWREEADRMIQEIEGSGFRPVIRPNWVSGWNRAGSWVR